MANYLDQIAWNSDGLVPAIAQDAESGRILMVAWMNREAILKTLESGEVTYWSRSRQEYWIKGKSSGHMQYLKEMRADCDGDALLCLVDQKGAACHTFRQSCFYYTFDRENKKVIVMSDAPK